MRGKEWEKKVANALRPHGFLYKMRDYAINPQRSYPVRALADYFFAYHGAVILIECKSIHEKRFRLSNITQSQLDYSKKAEEHGLRYYFLINYRDEYVIMIRATEIHKAVEEGKKSLSFEELMQHPHRKLERGAIKSLVLSVMRGKNINTLM